ncbi:MAG: hypothetical protein CRU78_02040 [Candidatus Accumulibacter phosphatis]|uniref:HTH lysR-type domain-containing protein n=1 Tax=Candidatus Accumulibacter phosphatis TaxID=327160 RepID=A0A6A7RQF3_9PROT|nr:hypothetical protein [Candidatus Accumulibacter phosphatis]
MTLRQLRYLAAGTKHGSFSNAAEEVFLAQSALSPLSHRLLPVVPGINWRPARCTPLPSAAAPVARSRPI